MAGDCPWTEALNDVIVETIQDILTSIGRNIILWKVLKEIPEPENSEKIVSDLRADLLKKLDYIQTLTEERRKTFLFGDEVCRSQALLYRNKSITLIWFKAFHAFEIIQPTFSLLNHST